MKRTPGSFVEEKSTTLVWHYRSVDSPLGVIRSRELIEKLYQAISNTRLQVIQGNKVIEVRVLGLIRERAVKKLFRKIHMIL